MRWGTAGQDVCAKTTHPRKRATNFITGICAADMRALCLQTMSHKYGSGANVMNQITFAEAGDALTP